MQRKSSLLVDIGIILGFQLYFADQPITLKSAISTLYLVAIYGKVICLYLANPFANMVYSVSQGIIYFIFVVLAFKVPLLTVYEKQALA